MTTKVTVEANHGWPVDVTTLDKDQEGNWTETGKTRVPANEKRDFYIHSHRDLKIHEVQPEEIKAEQAAEQSDAVADDITGD
jgi:hypothetical protein